MKTRKLRKAILTLCSALLLVSLSVGITLAYLTSETGVVQNTFTVGKVAITLDEAESTYDKATNAYVANTATEDDDARTSVGQNYKLMPGIKIDKDPTVTVLANSEECFVRAYVTVSYNEAAEAGVPLPTNFFTEWIKGYDQTKWVPQNDAETVTKVTDEETGVTTVTRTYELRYDESVKASTEDQKFVIFTDIELPTGLDNNKIALLEGFKIDVQAQAIQADGFNNSADAAWATWEN